jgi:hypothetical protein
LRAAFLIALSPLAACVPVLPGLTARDIPPEEVRIASVAAAPTRLTVRLSDGARCVARRPEAERGGWSGVTADCGYALPFTVSFRQDGSASRFVIEDPTGVPVAEDGGPGPRAEVFITDVDGQRRLFIAPLGRGVRFETEPPPAPAS